MKIKEILASDSFKVGNRIQFEMELPSRPRPVSVVAEIKWRRIQMADDLIPGVGLKFLNMPEESWSDVYTITRKNEIVSFIPMGRNQ